MMTFTDESLWIDNASDAGGTSIRKSFLQFCAKYGLSNGAWQIRAFGEPGGSIRVWIGMPPAPTFRHPWDILDSMDAGPKSLEILEDLLEKGKIPSHQQVNARLSTSA
jgi:hypothetical protein